MRGPISVAVGILLASTNLAAAEAPESSVEEESAVVGLLSVESPRAFMPKFATAPIVEEEPEPEPQPVSIAAAAAPPPCWFGPPENLGLTHNAARAYLALCALFPEVSAFGGLRPGDWGDHGTGRAIDCMISSDVGDAISEFILQHAGEFGVSYVIWRQRIRYPGGGWQYMEDRGSVTENHYDHVHISFH